MCLRSALVSRQSPDRPRKSFGLRPRACFSGLSLMYQSRCQSNRYWYAPIRNEPEPQAGSRMRSLAASLGVIFFCPALANPLPCGSRLNDGAGLRLNSRLSSPPSAFRLPPSAIKKLSHRVAHDVVYNISGRVINAAGLAHLWLFLDLGLVPFCEPDYLAQELLVDLAQDFGWKY